MKWEEKLLGAIEKTSNKYIDIKEFEIGRIISTSPLQIMNGDLPLFEENLYINEELLAHTREFSTLNGTNSTITNGTIIFESSLKANDLVMLREITKTKYIVLCKIKG